MSEGRVASDAEMDARLSSGCRAIELALVAGAPRHSARRVPRPHASHRAGSAVNAPDRQAQAQLTSAPAQLSARPTHRLSAQTKLSQLALQRRRAQTEERRRAGRAVDLSAAAGEGLRQMPPLVFSITGEAVVADLGRRG
jgi:hypothetical protein